MYDSILAPGSIGRLTLQNRMLVPAMVTLLANPDGTLSEAFMAYHERKARGGWAMVITEDIKISANCGASRALPGLWEDGQIRSHLALTERVHAVGGKLCAQLYHAGAQAPATVTGVTPVAPSCVLRKNFHEVPHELTVPEIEGIIRDFSAAAARAVAAGYDAIELHGAHGYLIGQFLSPAFNKRSDCYGGSLLGRNRFLLEVIAAVRQAVGPDFPLLLRLSACEYLNDGITLPDALVTARLAEEASVDALHCSAGSIETGYCIIPPSATPPAAYVDNAAAMRATVHIPVIAVGRINHPDVAETVLRSGKADFVSMGRASLADPDLPNRVKSGRVAEINACIGCVQGCIGENRKGRHCSCLVNPTAGYETELILTLTTRPKQIAVVGGGVAGAEAAIVAAARGHKVTLYEASDRLGGQWIAAACPPNKGEFAGFLRWQAQRMEQLGVVVHLDCPMTAAQLCALRPEAVVLATGAQSAVPPIPGIQRAVFAEDVLRGRQPCHGKVVVIGGGLVGGETAEFLAINGKDVTIIELLPAILGDGEPGANHYLLRNLSAHHVSVCISSKVVEVGADDVLVEQEGRQWRIPANTVVLAAGLRSDHLLFQALQCAGIPAIELGNAAAPKDGFANIREAFSAALAL